MYAHPLTESFFACIVEAVAAVIAIACADSPRPGLQAQFIDQQQSA
jgi:hypothetical protein